MSFIRTRVESKNFMNRNDRSKYRFTNIILLLLLLRGRFFFLHPKSVGGYRGIVYARYRTDTHLGTTDRISLPTYRVVCGARINPFSRRPLTEHKSRNTLSSCHSSNVIINTVLIIQQPYNMHSKIYDLQIDILLLFFSTRISRSAAFFSVARESFCQSAIFACTPRCHCMDII